MDAQEPKRTIAYICPHCRQSVIVEKSLFALAAAPARIPCPCGKSAVEVELLADKARLTVPCLFCGRDHHVRCSARAFVGEKTLAFSCAASGLDCCYVGREEEVYAATARLERAVDKLEQEAGERGTFLDELVMHEVLSELKDIAERGGISCTCGSKKCRIRVNYSSVDLECAQCGAQLRLNAATADDIDSICCQDKIIIRGKSET